jgi:hypothetical protein
MYEKPLPRITPDNKEFWDGCKNHQLLLNACKACNMLFLPPGPVCPFCFASELGWRNASGIGHVSAWTEVHKDWFSAFKHDLPYNAIQVELEEGPRLTSNLIHLAGRKIYIGMPVIVIFDDISNELTLPRFKPKI